MIDDVAYSASWVKRKKRLGGDEGGSRIRGGKEAGGEGESRLGGALRGPTKRFKGVLDVDVAEARKARQLGSTAGCQNLCPLPPPQPNRTTTYIQTSFFFSTTSSTSCASSTNSSPLLRSVSLPSSREQYPWYCYLTFLINWIVIGLYSILIFLYSLRIRHDSKISKLNYVKIMIIKYSTSI